MSRTARPRSSAPAYGGGPTTRPRQYPTAVVDRRRQRGRPRARAWQPPPPRPFACASGRAASRPRGCRRRLQRWLRPWRPGPSTGRTQAAPERRARAQRACTEAHSRRAATAAAVVCQLAAMAAGAESSMLVRPRPPSDHGWKHRRRAMSVQPACPGRFPIRPRVRPSNAIASSGCSPHALHTHTRRPRPSGPSAGTV